MWPRLRQLIALLIVLVSFSTNACTDSKPDDILSEPVYERILVELRLVSVYFEDTGDQSGSKQVVDSVWAKYGVTSEEFNRSHAWYEQDTRTQALRLRRLADSLSTLDTRISVPGD
jgi:hypothetical protein